MALLTTNSSPCPSPYTVCWCDQRRKQIASHCPRGPGPTPSPGGGVRGAQRTNNPLILRRIGNLLHGASTERQHFMELGVVYGTAWSVVTRRYRCGYIVL